MDIDLKFRALEYENLITSLIEKISQHFFEHYAAGASYNVKISIEQRDRGFIKKKILLIKCLLERHFENSMFVIPTVQTDLNIYFQVINFVVVDQLYKKYQSLEISKFCNYCYNRVIDKMAADPDRVEWRVKFKNAKFKNHVIKHMLSSSSNIEFIWSENILCVRIIYTAPDFFMV